MKWIENENDIFYFFDLCRFDYYYSCVCSAHTIFIIMMPFSIMVLTAARHFWLASFVHFHRCCSWRFGVLCRINFWSPIKRFGWPLAPVRISATVLYSEVSNERKKHWVIRLIVCYLCVRINWPISVLARFAMALYVLAGFFFGTEF